jgi:aldose 1-epimerase
LETLTLSAGELNLELLPQVGGSIAGFWSRTASEPIHWLRYSAGPLGGATAANQMACFPLVPYSNRIRHGCFQFEGRSVALPLNVAGQPHSLHGHGWQAAWHIAEIDAGSVALEFQHAPDEWPYPYRAVQSFSLLEDRLDLTLSIRNAGDVPMPAGLGWHPYFDRTGDTRLSARVGKVWLTDEEVMPTRLVEPPDNWQPGNGVRVEGLDIDNVFVDWDGELTIEWPTRGARLAMRAAAPLDKLVLFAPPGQDFFCAEPVSHITDAFNLHAAGHSETGIRVLAPGDVLEARVTFLPSLDV